MNDHEAKATHKGTSRKGRYPSPWASAGYINWQLTLRWRAAFEEALTDLGLTPTQWSLLLALGWLLESANQYPNQRTLAAFAGTNDTMTSQLLRLLESRGLIQRQFEGIDVRAKHLKLTESGEHLLQEGLAKLAKVDARFYGSNLLQHPQLLDEMRDLAIRASNTGE